MKKIFLLICAFTLVFTSCEQEGATENSDTLDLNKNVNFERLTNSTIGSEKDGKVKLYVSDEKVLEVFKEFAISNRLGLTPQSFEIVTIDNNNYLRFYSKDHKASTIALIKDNSNQYMTGRTVCTSSACASCCGCIPNGDYCTRCERFGPNGPVGDCTRSTTGEDPIGT